MALVHAPGNTLEAVVGGFALFILPIPSACSVLSGTDFVYGPCHLSEVHSSVTDKKEFLLLKIM